MSFEHRYIIKRTYKDGWVSYAGHEQIVDEYDNEMVVPYYFRTVEAAEEEINSRPEWIREGATLEVIKALLHFENETGRIHLRDLGEPDDWGR